MKRKRKKPDAKDREIERLREKVRELELQVEWHKMMRSYQPPFVPQIPISAPASPPTYPGPHLWPTQTNDPFAPLSGTITAPVQPQQFARIY